MEASTDFRVGSKALRDTRFAVFGVGNSLYEDHFNAVAKTIHDKLALLGGQAMCPLGLGDEDAGDLKGHLQDWSRTVRNVWMLNGALPQQSVLDFECTSIRFCSSFRNFRYQKLTYCTMREGEYILGQEKTAHKMYCNWIISLQVMSVMLGDAGVAASSLMPAVAFDDEYVSTTDEETEPQEVILSGLFLWACGKKFMVIL